MYYEEYEDDEKLSDEEIAERQEAEYYLKEYDTIFRPWEDRT